ncbi:MAG: PhoH family protein [Thermoprotei archaeon]|nr:MAG: PhoH family protein [Thermoprotei archaeon]
MGSVWDKLKPLTPGQEEMYKALTNKNYEVLGFFGPTGTGKSLFSLAYGIQSIIDGKHQRFIIIKPVVDIVSGEELTLHKSPEAFITSVKSYIYDVIGSFIDRNTIEKLIDEGKIVIADSHFLRGRTFDESVVFLDDIQSLSPESIIEAVVRVGRNSRLIVAGDPAFQALREVKGDPAALIREVLISEERSKVVDLGIKDIVREGAKRGLRLLLEYKLRSRELSENEKRIYDAVKMHAPDADIITVVDIESIKKQLDIESEHVPDALIIAKHGHLGRLVGKGGERINKAEEELGKRLRGIELTLDFREAIRAVHPTSWIWKHIEEVDFAGPNLQVKVYDDVIGAMVGQRGVYVRFLDTVFRKLIGVGVRVIAIERTKTSRKRR